MLHHAGQGDQWSSMYLTSSYVIYCASQTDFRMLTIENGTVWRAGLGGRLHRFDSLKLAGLVLAKSRLRQIIQSSSLLSTKNLDCLPGLTAVTFEPQMFARSATDWPNYVSTRFRLPVCFVETAISWPVRPRMPICTSTQFCDSRAGCSALGRVCKIDS